MFVSVEIYRLGYVCAHIMGFKIFKFLMIIAKKNMYKRKMRGKIVFATYTKLEKDEKDGNFCKCRMNMTPEGHE